MLDRAIAALEGAHAASSDFDLNPDVVLPEGRKLRAAGVLVAVTQINGVWSVGGGFDSRIGDH